MLSQPESSHTPPDPGQRTVNWGILGTGKIAATFARQLPASRMGRLVAVGSRTLETAKRFAAAYGATGASTASGCT